MFENVIIEIHDGKVELKWSVDADAMCADIRSFATKTGVIGGPTYCKVCEMRCECPLKRYRETIEKVQRDQQRDYDAGFETPERALYHLDKALYYLLIASKQEYDEWKQKELMKIISCKLAEKINDDIEQKLAEILFTPQESAFGACCDNPGFVNNSTVSGMREDNG